MLIHTAREEWVDSGLAIRIDLTQGQFAIVDHDVSENISQRRWFAARARDVFYAHHTGWKNHCNVTIRMHRVVMDAPSGVFVDHINGDTLDNRRDNLRLCSGQTNAWNQKKRKGSSRYKGVAMERHGKWLAYICVNRKLKRLGMFLDEQDAAATYNKAAIELFGVFARLNLLEEV